jgi:uncharacterized protein (TIGR02246 family)
MHDELRNLNETWNRAWFDKDAATVDRLMADDYVYVAPNGRVMDRHAILAVIRSPSYAIHHGANTEVIVRPLGEEAAVIRRRWQGEVSFEGGTYKEDHRCVMVWGRVGDRWQLVLEQCALNTSA